MAFPNIPFFSRFSNHAFLNVIFAHLLTYVAALAIWIWPKGGSRGLWYALCNVHSSWKHTKMGINYLLRTMYMFDPETHMYVIDWTSPPWVSSSQPLNTSVIGGNSVFGTGAYSGFGSGGGARYKIYVQTARSAVSFFAWSAKIFGGFAPPQS